MTNDNSGEVAKVVANAMIMTGEKERTTDLRGEPLPSVQAKEEKA